MNKKICSCCGLEKQEDEFYRSRLIGQARMDICKTCFVSELFTNDFYSVFRKYNIPFLFNLWNNVGKHTDGRKETVLQEYMKTINSLPQYRGLVWKDSILEEDENTKNEVNFYDSIITNLKKEASELNKKLSKIRDTGNDMNNYISTLKSLRETLDLISKYDWRFEYSEYKVKDDSDNWIKQISVWEQNHDNQIRNHKFWNVISDICESTASTGSTIGKAFKNI